MFDFFMTLFVSYDKLSLIYFPNVLRLRWYGTPPCSDVLFIEINNKIKSNFMNSFFL